MRKLTKCLRVSAEHNKKRTDTGVTPDQRGRNTFNNRVTAEQTNLVHEHISLIPSRRSHYTIFRNAFKHYVDTPDKLSQMAFLNMRYRDATVQVLILQNMLKN